MAAGRRGRPPKFDKRAQKTVLFLALKSFTDKEITKVLEITEQTLNNWKKAYPDFFESLKDAKKEADKSVEKSLFERATGYEHPEEKIFNNNGQIVRAETTKHYPPDPTSMIFWLKNRQPDKWRDKQELDLTLPKTIKVVYDDGRKPGKQGQPSDK